MGLGMPKKLSGGQKRSSQVPEQLALEYWLKHMDHRWNDQPFHARKSRDSLW